MGNEKLDAGFVRSLIDDIECSDYQPVELNIDPIGKILLPKEYPVILEAYENHHDLMEDLFLGHVILSVEEIKSQYESDNELSFFHFAHLNTKSQITNEEPFVINGIKKGIGEEVIFNLSRFIPVFAFQVGAGYILHDSFEGNFGRLIISSYYIDGDVIGNSILDYLKDIESGLISGKYTVHVDGYIEM